MTGFGTVMLISAGAIAAVMIATWLLSVRLKDVSIIDIAFGPTIVLVAWLAFVIADGSGARKALVVALTTVWGLRLAAHTAWRKASETGEDFRYREMRERHGERFPLTSLWLVFGFQGLGIWAVALPVQAAQVPDSPSGLAALDFVGIAIWTIGIAFETIGDLQLGRFRSNPENRGKLIDRGLWRYSRHPNYFGELCVWWGLYAIALSTGEAWWSVVGPLTMTWILLRLFGVPVMEAHLAGRPGYEDYARRTNAFIPWPPRR